MLGIADYYTDLPLEGSFLIYDRLDDAVKAIENDDVPQYVVARIICKTFTRSTSQYTAEEASLYLKPDQRSLSYCINSASH